MKACEHILGDLSRIQGAFLVFTSPRATNAGQAFTSQGYARNTQRQNAKTFLQGLFLPTAGFFAHTCSSEQPSNEMLVEPATPLLPLICSFLVQKLSLFSIDDIFARENVCV